MGNPIAAAGLMKVAELFWQLRGEAGGRQVPGTPERGVAQAWGDLMQVGTVVVMGVEPSGSGGGRGGDATAGITVTTADATARPIVTPPAGPRGRGLSEEEFRASPGAVEHSVDARYEWDAGVAVGRFLDGLRDGRILGRACAGCERVLVPPRMFCERCFRQTDRWVEVESTGVVQTFSRCHVAWDMRRLETPEIPAVISIDGSDGGFLHVLGEVDPGQVSIGMPVEAVCRTVGERTGSILDIAHFRPRRGEG